MTLTTNSRIEETWTGTGTGAVVPAGAVTGFRTFAVGVGDGNTCYYCIENTGTSEWEVGFGTYTASGNSLARTTLITSSTGSFVSFTAGTKKVYVTYPGEKAVILDANGFLPQPIQIGSGSSTNAGWKLGYYGSGTYSAIWPTSVTPTLSNYSIAANATDFVINTGGSIEFAIGGSVGLTYSSAGLDVTARVTSQSHFLVGSDATPSAGGVGFINRHAGGSYAQYDMNATGGGLVGSEGSNVVFYTYTGAIGSETYTKRMTIDASSVALTVGISSTGQGSFGGGILLPNITTDTAKVGISWYTGTNYGIFKTAGTWVAPNYQQLLLDWETGVIINGGTAYGASGTSIQPSGGPTSIGGGLSVAGQGSFGSSSYAGSVLTLNRNAAGSQIASLQNNSVEYGLLAINSTAMSINSNNGAYLDFYVGLTHSFGTDTSGLLKAYQGLSVTGTISSSGTITAAGTYLVVQDTSAYSPGSNGGILLLQGLDSSSVNNNLGTIQALAKGGRYSDIAFKLGVSGSVSECMRLVGGALPQLVVGGTTAASLSGVRHVAVNLTGGSYTQYHLTTDSLGGTIGTEGENLVFYTQSGALGYETYTSQMTLGAVGTGIYRGLWAHTSHTANTGYDGYGFTNAPTINKAIVLTHADFVGAYFFEPTIGGGGATVTNATTLKINAAPSAGINNRALWVASGTSELQDLVINDVQLLKSNTTLNNGAGASVGTLTNAPIAGNPTKWVKINDNGTSRYIPAW